MLGPDKLCSGVVVAVIALLFVPLAIAQKDNSTQVLRPQYQNWLDQDVRYIITDRERAEFAKLTNNQGRDEFVIRFWEQRNPDLGSDENKFKEEHYRRLAYVNTNFAENVPGYETDRGRIYILYGPPDQIDHHFSAAGSKKAGELVGGGAIPYDWQLWHYRYIEGLGKDMIFEFVDTCGCGRYEMPVRKDELNKYKPKDK